MLGSDTKFRNFRFGRRGVYESLASSQLLEKALTDVSEVLQKFFFNTNDPRLPRAPRKYVHEIGGYMHTNTRLITSDDGDLDSDRPRGERTLRSKNHELDLLRTADGNPRFPRRPMANVTRMRADSGNGDYI